MTSMRRNDVASTSCRRHVPTRFLINQRQIITLLILKSDIIENSRIELRGIVSLVPSNQIKVHLLLLYPSTWYICDFFLFHIEIEGKGGWIIGGPKGMLPPLSNYWPPCPPPPPPPPLPTPMTYLLTYQHKPASVSAQLFTFAEYISQKLQIRVEVIVIPKIRKHAVARIITNIIIIILNLQNFITYL